MASILSSSSLAQYRTQDPIENLLLRVQCRRRAGPGLAPWDELDFDAIPAARAGELEECVREFHWQQKEFSPYELLKYYGMLQAKDRGELNPILLTPLNLEYMEVVRQRLLGSTMEDLLAVPDNGMIMYTITDRDVHMTKSVSHWGRNAPTGSLRGGSGGCA